MEPSYPWTTNPVRAGSDSIRRLRLGIEIQETERPWYAEEKCAKSEVANARDIPEWLVWNEAKNEIINNK